MTTCSCNSFGLSEYKLVLPINQSLKKNRIEAQNFKNRWLLHFDRGGFLNQFSVLKLHSLKNVRTVSSRSKQNKT